MIVAIDATSIGSQLGGDETATRALLRGLRQLMGPEDQVLVLAAAGAELPECVRGGQGFSIDQTLRHAGIRHFAATVPLWLASLVRRGQRPDVVISLTHAPLWSPFPVALLVPDLSFLRVPDAYPPVTRFRLRTLVRRQVNRAAMVLTVSEFSRTDLMAAYGLAPEKVAVIPLSIDPPRHPEPAARDALTARGVRAPYLLYLGNLHPRKNVALAITEFRAARAADDRLAEHQFVIAGRPWFGSDAEARAAADAEPGEIVLLDRVSDAEREVLLTDAAALVYLSAFEGFGLPPLEAMARDTPVLASSLTAVPEICGDAAVLVDPGEPGAVRPGLVTVLLDPSRRAQLIDRGRRRVSDFDVDATGRALAQAIGWVVSEPHRRPGVVKMLVVAALTLVALIGSAALAGCQNGGPTTQRQSSAWQAPTQLPAAEPMPGSRLAFNSDRTGTFELFSMTTSGSDVRRLTDDPAWDSWSPRISPDRRTILFSRSPAGVHDRDPAQASLWAVGSDGSGAVELRPQGLDDWGLFGHAEWSPDGDSLVMVGGRRTNAQIFVTDRLGQQPRAVTDRPGTNIDPAFTPDGKQIVFIGCPGAICTPKSYEVYEVPVAGGTAKRLTNDRVPDYDPMYSPDGGQLAWLSNLSGGVAGVWDVRLRSADGVIRRLVGDDGITSRPQYSADGRTMYVHRIPPGGSKFDVFAIRLDGSGLTNLTGSQPGNNEYPSP